MNISSNVHCRSGWTETNRSTSNLKTLAVMFPWDCSLTSWRVVASVMFKIGKALKKKKAITNKGLCADCRTFFTVWKSTSAHASITGHDRFVGYRVMWDSSFGIPHVHVLLSKNVAVESVFMTIDFCVQPCVWRCLKREKRNHGNEIFLMITMATFSVKRAKYRKYTKKITFVVNISEDAANVCQASGSHICSLVDELLTWYWYYKCWQYQCCL